MSAKPVPPASSLSGPVAAGAGDVYDNLFDARESCHQALAALDVGLRTRRVRQVTVYDDVVSDVLLLAELGITDVGENRDQEAAPKAAALAEAGAKVRWHFVGQLQRNKARSVAGYADVVESVDSVRLATALDREAARHTACAASVDAAEATAAFLEHRPGQFVGS